MGFLTLACNPKSSEQTPIIGTWQLISGTTIKGSDTTVTDYTKGQEMIKIITPTHFSFLRHDLNHGKDSTADYSAGGGRVKIEGKKYKEYLDYFNVREWEGGEFEFDYEITLLTVRSRNPKSGAIETSYCEPVGHIQVSGDYVESWQPQAMTPAALASARLIGRGDEKAADQAAVNAMRDQLNLLDIAGVVVIGEGERDEAPMLFIGEEVGTGKGPAVDIALDPLEGTTLTAKDMPNALTVIAMAPRGTLLHAPDVYMEKLAIGPGFKTGTAFRHGPALS